MSKTYKVTITVLDVEGWEHVENLLKVLYSSGQIQDYDGPL